MVVPTWRRTYFQVSKLTFRNYTPQQGDLSRLQARGLEPRHTPDRLLMYDGLNISSQERGSILFVAYPEEASHLVLFTVYPPCRGSDVGRYHTAMRVWYDATNRPNSLAAAMPVQTVVILG